MENNVTKKDFESFFEVLSSNKISNIISAESIRRLVETDKLDFDAAAKAMESFETNNMVEPDSINSFDQKVKNAINPENVKFDIIVNLIKNHDMALYNIYRNTYNDLQKVVAEMVEKSSDTYSSMLDHIDTVMTDAKEEDKAFIKKLRDTKLNII